MVKVVTKYIVGPLVDFIMMTNLFRRPALHLQDIVGMMHVCSEEHRT